MIMDAQELPDGSAIAADLVIIGGGMAGITLAREWAGKTGRTVAILEAGGREFDEATQREFYSGTGTLLSDGGAAQNIDDYVVSSRARFYGGSGNWWGGKCVPLDPADFAPRLWIKGSGWPFSREDLQPFYDRACDVLGLAPFDKDYAAPQHEGRPPINIGGDRHVTSLPRQFTKVTGRAPFEDFKNFCYDFTEEPNISVYLNANVTDFHPSADGKGIDRLGVACLNGKRHEAKGTVFVLACGGIENARLMLAANKRNGTRFGARSDALGRYFMGHTTIGKDPDQTKPGTMLAFTDAPESLSLYTDRNPGPDPHAVLGTTLAGQARYESPAFTVTMGLMPMVPRVVDQAIGVTAARIDKADAGAAIGPACWCYFMTENLPDPDSRITLNEETDALGVPRLHLAWIYGKADMDGFERSVEAFARELGADGKGRVCSPIERSEVTALMSASRHHMGTTRMNDDPELGVVDSDLKCHDADNLYIAGSSAFPTSGIANPTLTILALTLRLSDHLKARMEA